MSDEDALLAAIIANPDEDTPRLVYADWLQENGQPERAEFIRLQIENVGTPIAARPREAQLLRRCRKQWEKPFRALFPSGVFSYRRGFVAVVRTEWRFYQSSLTPLLRLTPIEQIIVGKSYSGSVGTGDYLPYASQPLHVRFCVALFQPDGDLDVLRLEPTEMEPYLRRGQWVVGCTPYRFGRWEFPTFRILDYANARKSGSQCRLAFRPFKYASEFDNWCPAGAPAGLGYWSGCWLVFQDGALVDCRLGNDESVADWVAAKYTE